MLRFSRSTRNIATRGAGGRRRPVLFLLIFSLFVSCAGVSPLQESETSRRIENVPFYPQEMYQCGPASLAGVLNYWGVSVSPEEIASEIYSRSAKGTLNMDLVIYAKGKGLEATPYHGSMEDLKRRIDSGVPVIVMVDYGFWVYEQNHFMIVLGYDGTGVFVHSGKEAGKHIPLGRFLRSWRRTGRWTLLVTR